MNEPGDPTQVTPPLPDAGATGGREGNPWEQRDQLGFGGALLEAIKLFATNPSEGFARTRLQGDYVGPMLFAIIIGWFCALISSIWSFLFQGSMLGFLPPEMRDQLALFMAGSAAGLLIQMILWPIFIVIGLFIGSAILHVCLMIVGGLGQSKSGFEGTFRVVSFSSVGQLAQVVPVVGGLLSMVWLVALLTIGGSSLHDTSRGRALAAALIPLVICCLCVFLLAFMVIGAIGSLSVD
jgi:hypothetical protein